jgi:hypothetical protein
VRGVSEEFKAAVTLAFITPVLTEIFSANMGPFQVLNPVGFFFQFLAYSVPVLLIRELATRSRAGLPGLFLMGLAYSLFNEGIIAKTLFFGPPNGGMEAYDGFTLGRIHVVWAVLITTWHALHAVVFPIALVSALFPSVREKSWLSTTTRVVFLALWLPASVLGFLKLNPEHAHWGYFAGFVVAMVALVALGARLPTRTPFLSDGEPGKGWQLCLGTVYYPVAIIGFFVASEVGAPFPLLAAWPFGGVALMYLLLRRKRWATYVPVAFVALGDYGLGSLLNMLIQLGREPLPTDKVVALALMCGTLLLISGLALRRTGPPT